MDARINFRENHVAAKVFRYLNSANKVIVDSTVPSATQQLMEIRASQINGCGWCVDMHTKEAVAAGETQLRLNLVATWREATVFTEPERAALELAEEGTRLADTGGGVSDETWTRAGLHYDEDQLAAMISLLALINAYNRINVINREPAGDYVAGQYA